MVSARRPWRIVSRAMTSAGAMLPRLTLVPKCLISQTCCAFCGASNISRVVSIWLSISSMSPVRISPLPRQLEEAAAAVDVDAVGEAGVDLRLQVFHHHGGAPAELDDVDVTGRDLEQSLDLGNREALVEDVGQSRLARAAGTQGVGEQAVQSVQAVIG